MGGGWGEEGDGWGVRSGSGCDVEYSDGGGKIQLTPFHPFFFFLQPLASSLKHMGREEKEDGGSDWGRRREEN